VVCVKISYRYSEIADGARWLERRSAGAVMFAILEVNTKTDLKIKLASIKRLKQRRVVAFDGYRALALRGGSKTRILSRN
jgi:hypothetical protein